MNSFDILWELKYKQLNKRRRYKWFDRFESKFNHSRFYTFREKTSNMYFKIHFGAVRYSVCKDRRYNMKMNCLERCTDR
jgi:hypothetical protein